MNDDPRCCGFCTCLIDAEGRCWCGQQWDGQKMCFQSSPSDPPDGASTEKRSDGLGANSAD